MKKIIAVGVVVIFLIMSTRSYGQAYKLGLGVRLSSSQAIVSNALSVKYFLNENAALEGLISFDPVSIGVLYEFHRPLGAPGLQWFYGGGGFVSFNDNEVAGAMGIVGMDYRFQKLPVNLSVDWKPELILVKEVGFEPAAVGLSIRFVF
jgi:hypothetical protein